MKNEFIKGLFIVYFFVFAVTPISFLIRLFYSRVLTIEEFGLFYAFLGILGLITIFVDLGLSQGFIHYLPKLLKEKRFFLIKKSFIQIFAIQFMISLIVLVFSIFLKNFIALNYFHSQLAVNFIPLFASIFLIERLFNLCFAFFQGDNDELKYSSMNPLRLTLVLVLSVLAFIFFKNNLLFFFGLIWILSFFLVFIYLYLIYKKHKIIFNSKPIKGSYLKKIGKYGFMVLIGGGATYLLTQIDIVMLTFFKGLEAVALYGVAVPVVSIIIIAIKPLTIFLFPTVSKLFHQNENKKISIIIKTIYNLGLFLFLPLSVLFFIFASEILNITFGSKYKAALLALRILSIAFFFKAFSAINFTLLDGLGQVKKKAYLLYFGAGLNVLLNLFLIPLYGINGAAIATTCVFSLLVIFSLILIKKSNYIISHKNWIKIIFSNMVLVSLIFLLKKIFSFHPYFEVAIISTIGILVYLGLGYFLKIVNFKLIFKLFFHNFKKG